MVRLIWLQMGGTLYRLKKEIIFILVLEKIMLEFGKFRQYEIGNVMKITPSFASCSLYFVFIFLEAAHSTGYYFVFFQRYYIGVCVCTCAYIRVCIFLYVKNFERLSGKWRGGCEYTKSEKAGNKTIPFCCFCFFICSMHCQGLILEKWSMLIEGGGPAII